jgi:hypothetical protein
VTGAGSTSAEGAEVVTAVAIDQSNHRYLLGRFQRSMVWGGTTLTSESDRSMFVAKIDASGKLVWAKAVAIGSHEARQIVLDKNGFVYIAGWFFQSTASFGSTTLTNPPYVTSDGRESRNSRMFVAKMKASDGSWVWARAGGLNAQTTADGLAVDSQDNVYLAGTFVTGKGFEKVGFGTQTFSSGGGSDIFLAKLDKDGKWLWARREGSSSNDYARGLAIDANDNIAVVGYFLKPMILGGTTLTPRGGYDAFAAKMDKDGKWLWARSFVGSDTVQSVATDASGDVYVAGMFSSAVELDACRVKRVGATDIFAARLGAKNGACVWLVGGGGSGSDIVRTIRVDASSNAYIVGRFYTSSASTNTATFGRFRPKASPGVNDWHVFVAKLSPRGVYEWVNTAGGTNNEYLYGLGVDTQNNVFVAGHFAGDIKVGDKSLTSKGSTDIFVASYDAKGTFVSAESFGGTRGGYERLVDVVRDASGHVYVAGSFSGTMVLGGSTLEAARGGSFVAKLDPQGKWMWAREIKASDPNGNGIELRGLAIEREGSVFVTGGASSSAFGALSFKTDGGSMDLFVAKLDATGTWKWVVGGGAKDEDDEGYALATDDKGAVYVSGYCVGGTFGSVTLASKEGGTACVGKINASGKWEWMQAIGKRDGDVFQDLAWDESGGLVVTGELRGDGTTVSFGSLSVPFAGKRRATVVAKLDGSGQWKWAKVLSGAYDNRGTSIVLGEKGNVYLAGEFEGSVSLGSLSLSANGGRDAFVAALDQSGEWLWARGFGSSFSDRVNGLALASDGSLLATGFVQGEAEIDAVKFDGVPRDSHIFVLALDTKGKALWGKQTKILVGVNGEFAQEGTAIAAGPNQSMLVVGQFGGKVSFGQTVLSSSGSSDLFAWFLLPPTNE